jgi:hypothetical protein
VRRDNQGERRIPHPDCRSIQTARKLNRKPTDKACAVIANRLLLPGMGLHQCLSENTGQRVPGRGQSVPSHVPVHARTAAKAGLIAYSRAWTTETDTLAEGQGIVPSVPVKETTPTQRCCSRCRSRRLRPPSLLASEPGPDVADSLTNLREVRQFVANIGRWTAAKNELHLWGLAAGRGRV